MTIGDEVRRTYDRLPYPFGNDKALTRRTWKLSMRWVDAFGRAGGGPPIARVLVAGCGDGTEAFSMQRRLPGAQIVAVDFSARSIAIARRLQRKSRAMRRIQFIRADLTSPRLPEKLGRGFDLVCCHGVLSYVEPAERAVRNFARMLRPGGTLYLGVNGARHVSSRLRRTLPGFDYPLGSFSDSPELRRVLRIHDIALRTQGFPAISKMGPSYLASDVFATLIRNLTLIQWSALARKAGLHLRGSLSGTLHFQAVAREGLNPLLAPRSRVQAFRFFERLAPSQFHRLLFSKAPERNPPWDDDRRLRTWRVRMTRLYKTSLPVLRGGIRDRLRHFSIISPTLNLSMDWRMPEWEIALLRGSDGARAIRDLLDPLPFLVPAGDLREQLYLLYHLGMVNLQAPPSRRAVNTP